LREIKEVGRAVAETDAWIDDLAQRLGWHDRGKAYAALRRAGGGALRLEVRSGTGNHSRWPLHGGPVDYLAEAAPHALRELRERLIVISRGVLRNEIALAIALIRGAPVLSINPRERGRGH
jgi:hypothetical protein